MASRVYFSPAQRVERNMGGLLARDEHSPKGGAHARGAWKARISTDVRRAG